MGSFKSVHELSADQIIIRKMKLSSFILLALPLPTQLLRVAPLLRALLPAPPVQLGPLPPLQLRPSPPLQLRPRLQRRPRPVTTTPHPQQHLFALSCWLFPTCWTNAVRGLIR